MKITEKLQHTFALSHDGAVDMVKACASVTVTNMSFMMSAGILYNLIKDMLDNNLTKERIPFYAVASIAIIILIGLTNYIQYGATFLSTYKESGVRRTALAEKLRKLPLSYFGKKNIADLTTTIMSDCAMIETASSHWIPELIGALISTAIVGVSMFIFFDWRMVLASFWVIPASFLLICASTDYQKKTVRKNNSVKMEMAEGIQECLETVRDLRANNALNSYMNGLDAKIKNVEKYALFTELKLAICVNSAAIILKLGIATTALVGGVLLADGSISLLTFFMFLMLLKKCYMVMQDVNLQLFTDSVESEVLLSMQNEDKSRADLLIAELDLAGYEDTHPMALSGGQKQRVAICSALAANAEILLFDEPTSGLDHKHMKTVGSLLRKLTERGKTVIVSTHDPELIALCCQYILCLEKGRIKYIRDV